MTDSIGNTPPPQGEENAPLPQVLLRTIDGNVYLHLPPSTDLFWEDILLQINQRLSGGELLWQQNARVNLQAGARLIDAAQLQVLRDLLHKQNLHLDRVFTQCRPTAIAAVSEGYSVEQSLVSPILGGDYLAPPLYLHRTIRSGMEIHHPGSVILCGDIHPGGEIIADGDILVWGKLQGKAHAGARGNTQSIIMALHLSAVQLQIATVLARMENTHIPSLPEVAYLPPKGASSICIVAAAEFKRPSGKKA